MSNPSPTVKKTHQRKKPVIVRGPKPGIVIIDGARVRKLAEEFRDSSTTVQDCPDIAITCAFTAKGLRSVGIYLGDSNEEDSAMIGYSIESDDFETAVRAMIAEISLRITKRDKEARKNALNKLTIAEQDLLGL